MCPNLPWLACQLVVCSDDMEAEADAPLSIKNLKAEINRPLVALGIEGSANKVWLYDPLPLDHLSSY